MKLALLVHSQKELEKAVRRLSAVKIPVGCAKCLVEFDGRETIVLPAYRTRVLEKPQAERSPGYKRRALRKLIAPVSHQLFEDRKNFRFD